jgi:2-polyprenyl-6-methoxyphenol hydroxylase-like FAD-dependent oxidoreductase
LQVVGVQLHTVVVGASLAGLFAAAAAAAAGSRVTVLDRDILPDDARARDGVPQGRQGHVLLHRGLLSAEDLLPGLTQDLIDHHAVRFDSGRMPWLGPLGWLPTDQPSYELISATRPLLEHLVRERVRALDQVTIVEQIRVNGLERRPAGSWQVLCEGGPSREAELVIDASGRSSRMPHWLAALGYAVGEPEQVDAHLGYACQQYRATTPLPVDTGIVVLAIPETGTGGLALPVEDGRWLVIAGGYGERRPSRDRQEFNAFLANLRDPVLAELTHHLEPEGDLHIHRQTGNRRHHYELIRDWPSGLLVVGDALCAFNPIYGQGITVAALQAQLIRKSLSRRPRPARRPVVPRAVQRQIAAVADLPWSIAAGEDLRHPSSGGGAPGLVSRWLGWWSGELAKLSIDGDRHAIGAFSRVYHLMGSPWWLFHPALVARVVIARCRGRGEPAPRPRVLDDLANAPHPLMAPELSAAGPLDQG